MIKWGIQEEFSENVGSSYLLCSCAISPKDFFACSSDQTFLISGSQVKYSFPVSFSAIYYLPDHEFVIGATTGITTLQIFAKSNPKNPYMRDFLLHQNLVSQIYCSLSSNILITVGGKDIKIWDIKMIKTSTIKFEVIEKASLPGSPLCSNGMNLIYIDEKRHRIFVPHFNGFVLYSFEGNVLEKQLKFSHFLYNAVSLLPSPRKYEGLDLSYFHFIDIFKRFAVVDSSANIHVYYKSGHILLSISPIISSSIIFIAFVNSEFLVTVNTTGEISLVNVKTSKVKIVGQIGQKPDRVDFFLTPEPKLFVISGRKLFKYKINLIWKLFYRPVEAAKSICRFCSPLYSARIGLLTSDGCVFLISNFKKGKSTKKTGKNMKFFKNFSLEKIDSKIDLLGENYKNRFLVGAASTRGCPRPVSYTYDRDCNETNILISMDDSTVHLFDYMNDDWYFKQILPIKSRLIFTFIGTELLEWCVCACGFRGDVVFYKYGNWEKITRISVGIKQCDFAFWSKKDGYIIVFCQDRLYSIGVTKFNRLFWIQFDKPQCAAFEEGDLIVSYKHGVLFRYTVTSSGVSNPIKCKFGNEITYLHIKYGCHIVVLRDNSIIIGDNQNIAISSIELPFTIFSVSFLSSDLDILIALDHEIMLIEKKNACPMIHPTNVSPDDLDNSKSEPFFNGRIPEDSNEKFQKWLQRRYGNDDFDYDFDDDDIPFRKNSKEVLKRIRQKLIEEEENEFKFIVPDEIYLNSNSGAIQHRIKIIENKTQKKKEERKPVRVITNPNLKKLLLAEKFTINEDGTKTFHYSLAYEQLRYTLLDFLVIEETFSLNRNEIQSIVAETDEELDRIYRKRKRKNRHKDFWFNEFESLDFDSTKDIDLYNLLKKKLKRSKSTNNINLITSMNSNNHQNSIKYSLSLSDVKTIDDFHLLNNNLIIYSKNNNNYNSNNSYYYSDEENNQDTFLFSILDKLKNELYSNDVDLLFSSKKSNKNDFASSSSTSASSSRLSNLSMKNKESSQKQQIVPTLQLSSINNNNQNRATFPKSAFDNMKENDKNNRNSKTRKSFSSSSKKKFPPSLARRASMLNSKSQKETDDNGTNSASARSFDTVIESFEREERFSLKRPLSETQNSSTTQPASAFDSQSSVNQNEKSNSLALTLHSAQNELFNNPNYQYEGKIKKKNIKKNKDKSKADQWKSFQKQQQQRHNSNVNSLNNQQKNNKNTTANDDGLASSFMKLLNSNQDEKDLSQYSSNYTSDSGFNFSIDFHQQQAQSNLPNNDNNSTDPNQLNIQIKEPSYAPMNINSSRRQKKIDSSMVNSQNYFTNKMSKTHNFELFNNLDEEEEIEEKIEEHKEKKAGRQLLINKDALALYNPMDVKRMIIHLDSNSTNKNQMTPPIKTKRSTQKRRIVIKRQQLTREKAPHMQNSYLF